MVVAIVVAIVVVLIATLPKAFTQHVAIAEVPEIVQVAMEKAATTIIQQVLGSLADHAVAADVASCAMARENINKTVTL